MKKRSIFTVIVLCILLCMPITSFAKSQNKSSVIKKTIYVNQTVKLEMPAISKKAAKTMKWKSNNRKIVRVTQNGKITGIKKGTATITAISKKNKSIKRTYKVTVKEFEQKVLPVKVSKIGDSSFRMGSFIDDKYVVLNSKAELDAFVKRINSLYKKSGYSHFSKFKKTDFYKKLAKYNKKFFKTKTLCVLENALPSSMQQVQEGDFLCTQKKSGKVYGQLEVDYIKTEGGMTADMFYEIYFIELQKSDADTLQGYEIKVNNR